MNKLDLIDNLYDMGCIKIGDFTLASGLKSPFYIDLRLIISHPAVLRAVADQVWESLTRVDVELLCGVPYTGLPMATAVSVAKNVPLVLVRKELKQYGTKKEVEGIFHQGQPCALIEDLVTTGGSVVKVAEMLRRNGLKVDDVAVLIDRGQGAKENLAQHHIQLHAAFTLHEMLIQLQKSNRLDQQQIELVNNYLEQA